MKTLLQAALTLIETIDNKGCLTSSRRDVTEGRPLNETSRLVGCIDSSSRENTRCNLYRLAVSLMQFTVVSVNANGQKIRMVYNEEDAINMLRFYKINRIKAWIEIQ